MSKQGSLELSFDPDDEITAEVYRDLGRMIADLICTYGPTRAGDPDLHARIDKIFYEYLEAIWPGVVANGFGSDDESLPERASAVEGGVWCATAGARHLGARGDGPSMNRPGTDEQLLDDIIAELQDQGIKPRSLNILVPAADRGLDEATIMALAELLSEAEAVAA
jgi:hypothetical protein